MTITEDVHGQQTALFLKKKKKIPINSFHHASTSHTYQERRKKKRQMKQASKTDREMKRLIFFPHSLYMISKLQNTRLIVSFKTDN